MKVFVTDKTLNKLKQRIIDQKPDSISIRKYKKGIDPESNVINKIKLSDNHRTIHKTGKSYSVYINKDKLKEIAKYDYSGGFLPLLPLILGGISAVAGLSGAASRIATSVKHNDQKLEEEKRHNLEIEKAASGDGIYLNPWKGYGMGLDIKDWINNSKLNDIAKKSLRQIIKNLSEHFKIERQGEGIFLSYPPQ
jgi:hypothetical protein